MQKLGQHPPHHQEALLHGQNQQRRLGNHFQTIFKCLLRRGLLKLVFIFTIWPGDSLMSFRIPTWPSGQMQHGRKTPLPESFWQPPQCSVVSKSWKVSSWEWYNYLQVALIPSLPWDNSMRQTPDSQQRPRTLLIKQPLISLLWPWDFPLSLATQQWVDHFMTTFWWRVLLEQNSMIWTWICCKS